MRLDSGRLKAIKFAYPENIPVTVGFLPSTWMKYREDLSAVVNRYPDIFGDQSKRHNYDYAPATYHEGRHTDAWGCVWENIQTGMQAIVTGHPVPTREDVHKLCEPAQDIGIPHGFMFLQYIHLRGYEEAMMDIAEEPPELQMLIDKILSYNVRQMDKCLAALSETDCMYFGDDLGTQHSLPISPEKWRRYFKPCYSKLYRICHEAGHYVYMHSDGHILPIIEDLLECGVDVINPQVGANGLDNLVKLCKGKVCVDLDLDRQMFPFVKPEQIFSHIEEAIIKLGSPEGGLWLKASIGPEVPIENIDAICAALSNYKSYYKKGALR